MSPTIAEPIAPASDVATDDATSSFDTRINAMIESLGGFVTSAKTLQKDAKEMKKDHAKEIKIMLKNTKKKTPMTAEQKKNSGFSKPMTLSGDLKTFLGLDADAMLSRTDVTKMINEYVRKNDLLNPSNKREISVWGTTPAGKALNTLLQPETGGVVTWFNLQKYLQKHYPKPAVVAATEPAHIELVVKTPVVETPVAKVAVSKPKMRAKTTARVRAAAVKA